MNRSPLTIATAQSHVSADVRENGREIRRLMRQARSGGACLAHFPEGALSGYTKSQINDWGQVDWGALGDELRRTVALAGELGLWVVFGCNHRLTPPHRPHNSLYVISDRSELVNRYDKRFLSHTEVTRFYTPGKGACVFEVLGWRFGCALCIEIQFDEDEGHLRLDCREDEYIHIRDLVVYGASAADRLEPFIEGIGLPVVG